MRILHTSDWHIGKPLEQINRIEEQKDFFCCLTRIVEEEQIDIVLVSGDIYDTYNPPAHAEELFFNAVAMLNAKGKRPVIVIAGNHDSPERLCAASPLAHKNGIILLGYPNSDPGVFKTNTEYIKYINSGPGWLELNLLSCNQNVVVLTLPYPSEARLEEVLSKDPEEKELQKAYSDRIGDVLRRLSNRFRKETINLIMSHLFIAGGKESESERTLQVGGALTVKPDMLPSNAHYAALGHLHRPQQIKNAVIPAYYSGSPLAYSFSEANYSKAVYVIEANPGKEAYIEEILLDCGKPLRRWEAKQGIMQAIEWCEMGRDKNAWIDLEISTDRPFSMEEQKKLRRLHPGIINIRPKLKAMEEELLFENRENKKIDELFKEFYKAKMGIEISKELMSVFVDVLSSEGDINET
jgi:exonuclease SbcD